MSVEPSNVKRSRTATAILRDPLTLKTDDLYYYVIYTD
jgi:hypothetical protein